VLLQLPHEQRPTARAEHPRAVQFDSFVVQPPAAPMLAKEGVEGEAQRQSSRVASGIVARIVAFSFFKAGSMLVAFHRT
jgi:hypothetical protein